MITSFVSGLVVGLSLIVAIGAQNAFVLRQGIRREHVLPVVAVCFVSDIALIFGGIASAGSLLGHHPWLASLARWGGAAFLLVYAALAARRARRPAALALAADRPMTVGAAITTTLALTWLNPHAYLDAFVLLGSIAGTHGDGRWAFGAGATLASLLWFTGLGFGARSLSGVFARPSAWRVLDGGIAVVMTALGLGLVASG